MTPQSKIDLSLSARARVSLGISEDVIYRTVANIIERRHAGGGLLLDIGCGVGSLRPFVEDLIARYRGVDAVAYESFPADQQFVQADLDGLRWPIDDGVADVTVALEIIEHLENPRAFCRELARITRPGGLVVVTTPNQLSILSKLTLVVKNQFNAFQNGSYPAHRTALLEGDLLRIAAETRLVEAEVRYSDSGRIPGTPYRWPALRGRAFSDSLAISAKRAHP